jgi:acetyl-CoA synthetase
MSNATAEESLSMAGFVPRHGGHVIPIPERANLYTDTVGRWADGVRRDAIALVVDREGSHVSRYSFAELATLSAKLARVFSEAGIGPGVPVAVHTGQSLETALTHLAVYRLGGIVVTLSTLYGPDTVRHILADSGVRHIVTEGKAWNALGVGLFPNGSVPCIFDVGDAVAFRERIDAAARLEVVHATLASDPALLMYTSGSTGMPKGLLHAHRILHAYLPTVRLFYNLEIGRRDDAVFWSPADWAWVGGLLDLVLPAWAAGHPVVACEHRFEPGWAFDFMTRHRVTHTFMTPTALKRLAEVRSPKARWPQLCLAVVCTGGESLPSEIVDWCEHALGAVCNEFYGLTEFNHLIGNCEALYPIRPGSMGRAYPGHRVAILDDAGAAVQDGEVGEICASIDDPTRFLGYWGQLGIPERMRIHEWLRTNDLAYRDSDGYIWYQGRNDDLIKSAGYRIGPAEVEDALVRHPAVAEAAVIASPDANRGAIVKALVRLHAEQQASASLARELQEFVKARLAAYKYPREVEFVTAFPLTSSGKIRRDELRRREYERKGVPLPGKGVR